MHLAAQPVHQRSVRHGPLVLVPAPLKSPTPATDRDRTVSRRSEPSSRATLIGEQPNLGTFSSPRMWRADIGCQTPLRRYELLGGSACYPRVPFILWATALPRGTAGSLCSCFQPVRLVGLPVKPPSAIALCGRLPIVLKGPLEASVTLLEATTPVKLPAKRCPPLRGLEPGQTRPYFNSGSPMAGATGSKPPAYPTSLPQIQR